jgi:glycosyltransferase involved in cell wall biosynthesis
VDEDELAVGAIGRLVWEKGGEHLIRAWPQVRARVPRARLFILGEGELKDELKALAAELGMVDSCTFTGFEPDVPTALAGMDVFALPSIVEGLPMVLLEAMAAGKPVVASRIAGSVEVITEDVDGLLVEPGDADGLAQALVRVLQSPALATRLGAAAQSTISQRFALKRVIRETDTLYQSLIVQSRREELL